MATVRTLLLGLVMLATGIYFVLYLYGWEWYRALVVGIIFVAAEQAAMGIHYGSMIRKGSVSLGSGTSRSTGPDKARSRRPVQSTRPPGFPLSTDADVTA